MGQITFAHPNLFFLLILLIPLIAWYILKHKHIQASLQISTLQGFNKHSQHVFDIIRHIPFALRILSIATIITVLARPQAANRLENKLTEGIDIIMALDVSGSMQAMDFTPNRLEAAKSVATEFVSGRQDDKIGLVVFAGESFTQCPLTTDKKVLVNLFNDISLGMLEDGTAIGMGLATAVSRIKDSQAKSKVIILLTDGENNMGDIAPLTAAEIAKTFGIRVYTVGVGTIGMAKVPKQTVFGIQYDYVEAKIDEPTLKSMAEMTGGKYFRATDNEKLASIYEEIDKMEKTKIEIKEYMKRSEEFLPFALLAALLLIAEILIRNTLLRNLP
ncbi:MAG: VWA domain-containing protein [Marinilabiliaceae bacterium]|nr:VWA domain-containing protein [Marinilabiliaceae bacterium]